MSDLNEHEKVLVLARLEALPSNVGISVGDGGSYTKNEIIQHVEDEDDIGRKFIEIDLEFLRALKEGALFG